VYLAEHWFDGLCQLHKFEIVPGQSPKSGPRVRYRSRHIADGVLRKVRAGAKVDLVTFAQPQDPCESIFRRVQSAFVRAWSSDPTQPVTPNVHVVPFVQRAPDKMSPSGQVHDLKIGTDCNAVMGVNADDLSMTTLSSHTTLHPALKGPMCGAHYTEDPETGDRYNYNLEFGYKATYRVFRIDGHTGETEILATINDAPAAYIHSICISSNYVVLAVWGAHFSKYGLSVLYTNNIIDALDDLDPSKPVLWYVIDRRPTRKGVVARYESPAMFAFHCVNAFEMDSTHEDGQVDLFVDIPCYPDLSVLKRFYYGNLISSSSRAQAFAAKGQDDASARPQYRRFRLANVLGQAQARQLAQVEESWRMAPFETLELPSVNPSCVGKRHRYVYGLVDRGLSTFVDGISKLDCDSKSIQVWSTQGHTPGEPVFVPDPHGEVEDDGALLSVVLDGFSERSYLLILNARDLSEVARAEVGVAIHHGFHGTHVPMQP
jgi:torulene dioxygenase